MPLYGPSTATATVGANTNMVTITGMDISNGIVAQGMTISFGARDRATGDAWVINTVTPNGTSGGTLTLAGSVPTAYNSAPFLIDTRGFLGTDSSYAAAVSLKLLSTQANLLGSATNLFTGSRQVALDKLSSTAVGRILFQIAGRSWGSIEERTFSFTPTGGQATSIETLAVRAFSDGTTPTDALLFDLSTGTGDLRKGAATMVAGSTVDLGSAPMGKVAITGGSGVTVNSFGAGRHLERIVRFVDGGATLAHNATSLDLPGGINILTRAGDRLHVTSDGSGNWRVVGYHRADGTPLILPPSAQRASFRNRVRNGGFTVNQRSLSGNISLGAGAYGHDGWKAGAAGCSYSVGRGNGVNTLTISGGSLVQVVEGPLYIQNGGTFTLSWAGVGQARINGGAYGISPLTVSDLPPDTNVTIEFGTGYFANIQFEPGSVATPFEVRDDELYRCMRYFQYFQGSGALAFAFSNSILLMSGRLPRNMRTAPTITLLKTTFGTPPAAYDIATTNNYIGGSGITCAASLVVTDLAITLSGFSGLIPGAPHQLLASPLLSLSAEL